MSYVKANNLMVEMPVYEVNAQSMKMRVLNKIASSRIASSSSGITVIKALQDVSFEFNDGDRVGLVGSNGAGKSTLLRVLAGIYEPSAGTLEIQGKAVALLEMGLGMDDSMTGYQNVKLRGLLLGMTPEEIQDKTAEIVDFTGLGDYLDMPLRVYSSGMRIRLAFAISTAVEADVLLLDEVIGVGDAAFLEKANARLKAFHEKANIVFIASHSGAVISDMCNKVMWLEGGIPRFIGDVQQGLKAYSDHLEASR